MRMNNWNPSAGALLDWDVDEILTRRGGDFSMVRKHDRCSKCGGYTATSAYSEIMYYSGLSQDLEPLPGCNHEFLDVESSLPDSWALLLAFKRLDDHYGTLLDQVRTEGILKPLGAAWDESTEATILINGHHRVAIAVDLGLKTVPVRVYRDKHEVFAY